MMYWHFSADVKVVEGGVGEIHYMKLKKKRSGKERRGRWRVVTNAWERFGRLSKIFIIFDVNYQTP